MDINEKNRRVVRRDWGLIIFVIPLGILLIFIVGQLAVRLLPQWSLFANMRSGLNPEDDLQPVSLLQPLLPQILTPMPWMDTFLTPGDNISFPPFVVIDPGPTFTPVVPPTSIPPTPQSTPNTPAPTASSVYYPSPTSVAQATNTLHPPNSTDTAPPTNTAIPPTNTAIPPTNTAIPPTNTAILPTDTAISSETPIPTPTGYPSTPPPGGEIPPPPGVGDDPDGIIGSIPDGTYFILSLTSPVVVSSAPDGNNEIIYYEYNNAGIIYMDFVLLGISQFPDANPYFQVFNWFDGIQDSNTNADYIILPPDPACFANPECDNRVIPELNLYPYPGAGILIDAETAASAPPPGDYYYIIVLSPVGGSGEPLNIDAITIVP
ncbi:MAG: hypothetical protein L6Q45_01080 [Anaerolineales bacterium]|nr:hypothetical protein [Anaerolineales bacterium]